MLSQNPYPIFTKASIKEDGNLRDVSFSSHDFVMESSSDDKSNSIYSSSDVNDSISADVAKFNTAAAAAALVEAVQTTQIKVEEDEVKDESRIKVIKSAGDSAVVKIGGQKFVDFSGCCFNKEWIGKQNSDLLLKNTIVYQKYYLGSITKEEAIEACVKRCEWHIFHAIETPTSDSDDLQLQSASPLFVVYRRGDNGNHELYPIRSKAMKKALHPVYYVDFGDPEAPFFDNIFALLKFYDIADYLFVVDSHHAYAEVFPYWNCPPPNEDDSDYSAISSDDSWFANDSYFSASQSTSTAASSSSVSDSLSESEKSDGNDSTSSSYYSATSTALNSSREGETDCELVL